MPVVKYDWTMALQSHGTNHGAMQYSIWPQWLKKKCNYNLLTTVLPCT